MGGVICHVGLCFSCRYAFTYWGLLTADLENVKQLIVTDLHITISSVQNPRSFSLSTASYSLDGCDQSPVCESISGSRRSDNGPPTKHINRSPSHTVHAFVPDGKERQVLTTFSDIHTHFYYYTATSESSDTKVHAVIF